MKPSFHPLPRFAAVARIAVSALAAGAILVACGGGGDDGSEAAAPAAAGTSSFASGPITGFGSIIVNGVRYDDSGATVQDDEGGASSSEALKLGMGAEVKGGGISDDGSGKRARAFGIVFGSALVGPVSAVDPAAKTLVVLGQTVRVLDTTVIDARLVGGFAGIAVNTLLEVHATLDPTSGIYTATRLEPTAATLGFKIRGVVANLNFAAKTFTIGGTPISYAGVTVVPNDLADGMLLRVRLKVTPVAGVWTATRLGRAAPRVDDVDEAHLEGSITAFTSTSSFSVNGIPVDASGAVFRDGTAGIVLGAEVEVEGTSANGVIVARKVSLEDRVAERAERFELHGAITAIDTVAKTFVLRTVTVSYAAAGIDFRKGTAAQLAVGVKIEVRGTLAADSTTVLASRINFED